MSNPFNELFDNLRRIKEVTGSINNSLISRIYDLLDQMGIDVFCATSED
jgi:hypothetical protein